jgi:DNA-binding NarL/FixJ family response regulator
VTAAHEVESALREKLTAPPARLRRRPTGKGTLTRREQQILSFMKEGTPPKRSPGASPSPTHGPRNHIQNIFTKLDVHNASKRSLWRTATVSETLVERPVCHILSGVSEGTESPRTTRPA